MKIIELKKLIGIDTILGLDYETYFDQKYSLRSQKLSTSEYVRDDRFKAQCLGFQTDRQKKARWVPTDLISDELQKYDWNRTAILCHNTAFDGFILSEHFNIAPKFNFCTLSMARPLYSTDIGVGLDELARFMGFAGKVKKDALLATKGIRDLPPELLNPLGAYCADDVEDMWKIFRTIVEQDFPELEYYLIDHTIKAFTNPVAEVDVARARIALEKEIILKHKLIRSCAKYTDIIPSIRGAARLEYIGKQLSSNPKFAELLRGVGFEPPMKPSPTEGKAPIFAFAKADLDFQAMASCSDANVRKLCQARLSVKSTIGETRARRMITRGTTGSCKLPMFLNYGKARTLRWTGGDKFNPQNFPRGGEMRRCIKAPKGYKIIVVDSSQIEARMNAWLWGQDDLLEIFKTGGDPYLELAKHIYNDPTLTKKNNPLERFVGKVGILGLGYGMGGPKYVLTLAVGQMGPPMIITQDEGLHVRNVYRKKNYKIVNGWHFLDGMLDIMIDGDRIYNMDDLLIFSKDAVHTPSGFAMKYKGIHGKYNRRFGTYNDVKYYNKNKPVHLYGAKLDENIIQHLARLVVAEQIVTIGERYPIITMSHDECVYLAKTREAKRAYEFGLKAFRTAPDWCSDIPLDAEGGYDDIYSK